MASTAAHQSMTKAGLGRDNEKNEHPVMGEVIFAATLELQMGLKEKARMLGALKPTWCTSRGPSN